jgi:hypothetical protein
MFSRSEVTTRPPPDVCLGWRPRCLRYLRRNLRSHSSSRRNEAQGGSQRGPEDAFDKYHRRGGTEPFRIYLAFKSITAAERDTIFNYFSSGI